MPSLSTLWIYIIQGLAFGAVYAVTGTGLVVLYRTTGVVNLAFGAIGTISAHIAWSFLGGNLAKPSPKGVGFRLLGYPLLVAAAAGITLLYGVWLAPKLSRRDPLVKALGMVGVALLLLGFMKERWDTSKPRGLPIPVRTFKVGGAVVTTTQLAALVFSVVVVLLVNLFLAKSATGTAMRAVANDREVSSMLGVPVRRIEAIAWLASGVICGLVYLMLPDLFNGLDQGILTWFVIGALAGAIVGQFRSLWVTFAASIVIGVVESGLAAFDHGALKFLSTFRKMTPFVIAVIAILWISRRRTVVLAGREMR
jgi:branched-chain amino acid transport system permease protein